MPNHCESLGDGWTLQNGQCVYDPGTSQFTETGGTTAALDFGGALSETTHRYDWQEFFDPYDPAKEKIKERHAGTDIGQLRETWGLKSGQLGETYLQDVGGILGQAGTGTMDLLSSWEGGGQTMTGRKRRQRADIGRETARATGALGLGLRQDRAVGELALGQDITDIEQKLELDVFGAREDWEREQRATLNQMLGWEIYGDPPFTPQPTCEEKCAGDEQCIHECERDAYYNETYD